MMRMMRNLLAALFLFSLGCKHNKIVMNEKPFYNEAGGVSGTLVWAKNKGKRRKIDASITFENSYKVPVLIEANAISLIYNGEKSVRVLQGNHRLVLEPGVTVNEIVVFKFNNELEPNGAGKFKVTNLYAYKNDEKGRKLNPIIIPFTLNKEP